MRLEDRQSAWSTDDGRHGAYVVGHAPAHRPGMHPPPALPGGHLGELPMPPSYGAPLPPPHHSHLLSSVSPTSWSASPHWLPPPSPVAAPPAGGAAHAASELEVPQLVELLSQTVRGRRPIGLPGPSEGSGRSCAPLSSA